MRTPREVIATLQLAVPDGSTPRGVAPRRAAPQRILVAELQRGAHGFALELQIVRPKR